MFRAKMFVAGVNKNAFVGDEPAASVTMYGVYESMPDVEGNACEENRIFGKWTPAASFGMTVTNPDVIAQLEEGKQFYVDFTPVE